MMNWAAIVWLVLIVVFLMIEASTVTLVSLCAAAESAEGLCRTADSDVCDRIRHLSHRAAAPGPQAHQTQDHQNQRGCRDWLHRTCHSCH